ncbi:hypothetical protein MCEGEM3_02367 [Oxalobacteraceae bacterium]
MVILLMPTADDLTTAEHGSCYRPRLHYPLLSESCARGKLIRVETLCRGGGGAIASPDIIKVVEELLSGP